ncbi:MAG: hypothetical protein GY832_03800 [Chloroflexi bacterium]|nr:hypothetical protein [Chloroflexota bacterium]
MDFPERSEWEERIASGLGKLGERQRRDVMRALGNPPRLENLPIDFWNKYEKELRGLLIPDLEGVYLESAKDLILGMPGLGVDWDMVNISASRWSRDYGYKMVSGLTKTTREGLQETIPQFFEDGLTLGQLREKLGRWYGPIRADMIATTEVTRASVQGEIGIADQLRGQGIDMVMIWKTNNDEIVCPICGPRNNKAQGDGWTEPPPAHPRCRCWIGHRVRETASVEEQAQQEPQNAPRAPRFKTSKEAADWLESNGYVERAFFGKFDVRVSQDIADSVADHVNRFGSDLKFKYVGNNRELMKMIREQARPNIEKYMRELNADRLAAQTTPERVAAFENALQRAITKEVNKTANRYRMDKGAYAYALDDIFLVSQKYGSKYDLLVEALTGDIRVGWHPIGCNTPRSVADHEIGHIIQNKFFNREANNELNAMYREYVAAGESPSRYAQTTAGEFMAESWAAFLNNSEPGKAAKAVAALIDKVTGSAQ